MGLRSTFKTDKKLEVEGVWQEVGMNDHNGKPIKIHLSRMSQTNKNYAKKLEEVTKPHQSAIQNGAMDNDLSRKILQGVFVDTILLGWENLPKSELTGNDDDKEDMEFSKELALALFEEMPDLYDDWESRAMKSSSFREAQKAISAGN